jgi:hypothetical protein
MQANPGVHSEEGGEDVNGSAPAAALSPRDLLGRLRLMRRRTRMDAKVSSRGAIAAGTHDDAAASRDDNDLLLASLIRRLVTARESSSNGRLLLQQELENDLVLAVDLLSCCLQGLRDRDRFLPHVFTFDSDNTTKRGEPLVDDPLLLQVPAALTLFARVSWQALELSTTDSCMQQQEADLEKWQMPRGDRALAVSSSSFIAEKRGGLESLGARRWNACVRAYLELSNLDQPDDEAPPGRSMRLLSWLCRRLVRGDALSVLTAGDLSQTLSCLSSYSARLYSILTGDSSSNNNDDDDDDENTLLRSLLVAYCRRMRKQTVRNRAHPRDLAQCLDASRRMLHVIGKREAEAAAEAIHHRDEPGGDRNGVVREEVCRMAYTVMRQQFLLLAGRKEAAKSSEERTRVLPSWVTSTRQIATLWRLVVLLQLGSEDPVTRDLVEFTCQIVEQNESYINRFGDGIAVCDWNDDATAADLASVSSGLVWLGHTTASSPGVMILLRRVGEAFRRCAAASAADPAVSRRADPDPNSSSPTPKARYCSVSPRHACEILRAAALLHPKDATVVKPYVEACHELWGVSSSPSSSTTDLHKRGSQAPCSTRFLSNCTLTELSNLCWFLRRVQCPDRDLIQALACHAAIKGGQLGSSTDTDILLDDVGQLEAVSPRLVCRILTDFTTLFSILEEESSNSGTIAKSLQDVSTVPVCLSHLFELFGPHLLLSFHELSSRDLSSALCAYGKSAYTQDMGIFDHLVAMAASRRNELSLRQTAQCLWACGRMMSLEAPSWTSSLDHDRFASDESDWNAVVANPLPSPKPSPPYLSDAMRLADQLSQHAAELSTHDVTQAIWALGHLLSPTSHQQATKTGGAEVTAASSRGMAVRKEKLSIESRTVILGNLTSRAKTLTSQLSHREVANILWGMCRAGSTDYDAVYALTRRFVTAISQEVTAEDRTSDLSGMSSQDCALVLHAMARLDIRDAALFHNVTQCMLHQIEKTGAQSIAVALASHRAVYLPPPPELIDQWAARKLGLAAVTAA